MYLTRQNNSLYKQTQTVADTVIARYGTGGGNTPLCVINGKQSPVVYKPAAGTVDTDGHSNVVYCASSFGGFKAGVGTLRSSGGDSGYGSENLAVQKRGIRRLTPLECERLQGFPDNWTRISWRGKSPEQCPDSLRYKAIGNSMAVPVMRWIGERIQLFDSYYNNSRKKRKYVDYDYLYALLKQGPVSFDKIKSVTGLDKRGAYQVVTTLSLKYPVYSPERGMYALL